MEIKKGVRSHYPSLTPALIIDQNKGTEKGPQGQRRNEAKRTETRITWESLMQPGNRDI